MMAAESGATIVLFFASHVVMFPFYALIFTDDLRDTLVILLLNQNG